MLAGFRFCGVAIALFLLAGCAVPVPRGSAAMGGGTDGAVLAAQGMENRLTRLAALTGGAMPATLDVVDASVQGPLGAQTVPVLRLVFPDRVFFDFDSDQMRPEAAPICDAIAQSMRQEPADMQLTLVGHTDAIGSDAYNIVLSKRRATQVLQALIQLGVSPAILSTIAVGKREPIAPDDTEQGRAENRRVEFLISPALAANLAVVSQRPVRAAYLASDATDGQVEVFRPEAAAGTVELASLGSISLNEPAAPPEAAPMIEPPAAAPAPEPAPDTQPIAPVAATQRASPAPAVRALVPAARAVPSPVAPPAVPRQLAPAYLPVTPGSGPSY